MINHAIHPELEPFFRHTYDELGLTVHRDLRQFAHQGTLVLIGGAEDKTESLDILKATWQVNQAARVVICPSASRVADEVGDEYARLFSRLGAKAVDVIDPEDPEDADRPRHLSAVAKADLVFFSGGDQVKLANLLLGTEFLAATRRRFVEGATIGGTSAGAAVAGNPMIYDGNRRGFNKGTVGHAEGFGLVNNLIVDTHFLKRRRIARLSQAIAAGLGTMGIGLEEDTAIALRGDGNFTVLGSSVVTVLGGKRMKRNNYHAIENDELMTVTGLRLGFLAPGTIFNIRSWNAI